MYIGDAQQGHVIGLNHLFREMISVSPCYFGVIIVLRVFELHTMRLFASLQRLGRSGLMKMIVSFGEELPKLHIEEVKIRQPGDA